MQQDPTFVGSESKDKGLTPRELLKKHLNDPDHHVTDEELRSLKVGADAEKEMQVEKDEALKTNKLKSVSNKDDVPNPYKVLK